jgi:hypothetical protein
VFDNSVPRGQSTTGSIGYNENAPRGGSSVYGGSGVSYRSPGTSSSTANLSTGVTPRAIGSVGSTAGLEGP